MEDKKILVLIVILVVFAIGGLLYLYNPNPTEFKNPDEVESVACTMDAKLCPDGSYVGRTGPNCEFVCPAENNIPKDAIFEDGTADENVPQSQ